MEIDDRHVTATPEGVPLESVLAGLGSRFAAYAIDYLLQLVVLFLGVLLIGFAANGHSNRSAGLLLVGADALYAFVVLIGYFVICELFWSGRSVGKRLIGLRVVRVTGQAEGFFASLLRNIFRLVDALPALNLLAVILILATRRNQRLGDLVAGTVVIRDRVAATTVGTGDAWAGGAQFLTAANQNYWAAGAPPTSWLPPELTYWDVSAVPPQEWMMAQTFLNNRAGYAPEARQRLSTDIANRIWPYVSGPTEPPHPEQFLEMAMQVKAARG